MRRTLYIALALAFILLQPTLVSARSSISYALAARIDESALSGLISNPVIQSFDLSPDGRTVALLVISGSRVEAPLWLVTEDIATKHVDTMRELGSLIVPNSNFSPQVLYASSQRFLVVQDFRTIKVFDSKSLQQVRTIPPPSGKETQTPLFISGASNRDIFVCAYGPEQRLNPRFHTTPVEVEVIDMSSGERLGEWASEDVPQSISSNGDLIAVSSSQAEQRVLPLDVLNVHGQKVAELTGGYSFRKGADPSKPLGRVMGLFLGTHEMLLTPDENIDQTGHHSGESLQLVSVTGKQIQVQQSIKPRHYGSTGELAASADHQTVVAISWHVPAWALAHEWALPASSPELLVYRQDPGLQMTARLPIHGFGLKVGGWMENRRPRVSSDGSVIAIAQESGVTVLARNPPPGQQP